jgi:TRAP-type C4-dicarboxylate transport system substrate-binding protein
LPKNLTLFSTAAWSGLSASQRQALLNAAAEAEDHGWRASEDVGGQALLALRAKGMRLEKPTPALCGGLARWGERFAAQWVCAHGAHANPVFIPYHSQR